MDKLIHLFSKLGFWGFVLTFTVLAVVVSELLIVMQSYWLTGSFTDKNLLIVGFITPAIDAFILFFLAGLLLKQMRKQQESTEHSHQLEKSQKDLLQQYIDITDVMIVALDKQGYITHANQTTCDIMGFAGQEELVGKDWFKLYVPAEQYDQVRKVFLDIISGNLEPYRSYENHVTLEDGSVRLISWKNEYIHDSQGHIIGTLSSGKDITAERKVQDDLKEQHQLLRTVIDEIPYPVISKNWEGKFLLGNKACAELYNTTPEEMVGKDDGDFIDDKDVADFFRKNVQDIMRKGETEIVYEDSQDAETGEYRHYRSIKKPFKNAKGEDEILVIAQDITEEKRNLKDLYLLKHAIENINDAYYLIASDAHFVEVNQAAADMLGYSIAELKLMSVPDIDPNFPQEKWPELFSTIKQQGSIKFETGALTKSGTIKSVEVVSNYIEFEGEQLNLAVVRDITEQKQNLKQLFIMHEAIAHLGDAYYLLDKHSRFVEVNKTAADELGYSIDELQQLNVGDVDYVYPIEQFPEFWQHIKQAGVTRFESGHQRKDGSQFPVEVISNFITYDNEEYVLSIARNITEQKRQQERLDHIAKHDVLTDLPNRFMLNELLQSLMSHSERTGSVIAVLYLDLDGFKEINDLHGHEMGDKVLIGIANRIRQSMRLEDLVARIGGDEFVVVFQDIEGESSTIPMVQRLLDEISQPMTLEDTQGNEVTAGVSGSVGVTFYPQENHIGSDALLRQADQAMYQAKTAGKNQYQFFNLMATESVKKEQACIKRFVEAIRDQQMRLFYQPKVDMVSGAVIGFEALLRWQDPEKGLRFPDSFLPVVNANSETMKELGKAVFKMAFEQLSQWQAQGHRFHLSINISAHELHTEETVGYLQGLLSQHQHIHPSQIELEILETSALQDTQVAMQRIKQFQALGVQVSLDDFGTGFSTLANLKNLPVNTLKIDKTFVSDMQDDASKSIIEASIGLAHAFGCSIVAEGVETEEQFTLLKVLGCNLAQGYYIAKPMPVEEIELWLENWKNAKN